MSNIAHPHPDPPPLRALRALQGRGKSAQQFEFVRMTGILNRLLDACVVTASATCFYTSCRVGRKMISFTSTSSGWLMAKSTQRAKLAAGISLAA